MNTRSCDISSLWGDGYKIPWNDPAFSARILKEHLSQAHDLASRKRAFVETQSAWIADHFPVPKPTVLDLGCGPGLYAQILASRCARYVGLDFSPASIDHARRNGPANGEFRLADVTEADFGGPFNLVMMLYGEFNVFPPAQARALLAKAHDALAPGGLLLVERQRFAAVRDVGRGADSEVRAPGGGLFADAPYVCLTENRWFEEEGVAQQRFFVRVEGRTEPLRYRSTTKAWTGEEMAALLREAGLCGVTVHPDWPQPGGDMALVTARKPS
ncbi:class I SAM-dependent methyltransferase [Desulfovibrio sp. Huiquan2017]|uniref:class I SAM-dependent methyltransferase n=1 Tax=Desulfovibrio sp. Huiquan2017 TaxID=2816861 RepID=UPI001A9164BE|nr:class I SAM-dependent methyltransferase [Desulfovibrio sp. Huiquan2017]